MRRQCKVYLDEEDLRDLRKYAVDDGEATGTLIRRDLRHYVEVRRERAQLRRSAERGSDGGSAGLMKRGH